MMHGQTKIKSEVFLSYNAERYCNPSHYLSQNSKEQVTYLKPSRGTDVGFASFV